MTSCFNAYGTGAAFAMRQRIDDMSARASSPGGRLTIRLSCVGAENEFVTRCSATSRSHDVASNLRSTTTGLPIVWASDANASGPEWYIGPVVRWISLPSCRPSSPSSANTTPASVEVRSAPFGFPVVPDV